jgi:hypothetical protein
MDTSPPVDLEAEVGPEGNGRRQLAMHKTGVSPPMDLEAYRGATEQTKEYRTGTTYGWFQNIFWWIESVFITVTDHTCSNIISRDY